MAVQEKKKGRIEPTDKHRHYARGFLLRLETRHRQHLEAVKARTGLDVTAQIRAMIERDANSQGER